MSDPLKPEVSLLVKLGSIVVHVEEMESPDGHHLDKAALKTVLEDEEVKAWLEQMDAMALIPKKRNPDG